MVTNMKMDVKNVTYMGFTKNETFWGVVPYTKGEIAAYSRLSFLESKKNSNILNSPSIVLEPSASRILHENTIKQIKITFLDKNLLTSKTKTRSMSRIKHRMG